MKKLFMLSMSLIMGLGTYAQNCSKSRTTTTTTTTVSSCTPKQTSCTPKQKLPCPKPTLVYQKSPIFEAKKSEFKRLAFLFGPGVNFSPEPLAGINTGKIVAGEKPSDLFSKKNIAGQVDAFVGVKIKRKNNTGAHAIGIWGTSGLKTNENVSRLMNRQGDTDGLSNSPNLFGEIEAGILLYERIRLSAGVGNQQYRDLDTEERKVRYFTTSAGFLIPLRKGIVWNTAVTAMYGRDFQKISIRPMTGIMMDLTYGE